MRSPFGKSFAAAVVLAFSGMSAAAQQVNYSPAYFGPNANPVPESGNALMPSRTTVSLAGSYWTGKGESTGNMDICVEVPLLPECLSLKVWTTTLECWSVSPELYAYRNMQGGAA